MLRHMTQSPNVCGNFCGNPKIFKNQSIKAFVEGITVAVVGALFDAVIVIATRSILVIPTALIAVATILALI